MRRSCIAIEYRLYVVLVKRTMINDPMSDVIIVYDFRFEEAKKFYSAERSVALC